MYASLVTNIYGRQAQFNEFIIAGSIWNARYPATYMHKDKDGALDVIEPNLKSQEATKEA